MGSDDCLATAAATPPELRRRPLAPARECGVDPIEHLFLHGEPADLPAYFSTIQAGVPYQLGSTVRLPDPSYADADGLLIPQDAVPRPIDYAGVYLIVDDYFDMSALGREAEFWRNYYVQGTRASFGVSTLVSKLAMVASLWNHEDQQAPMIAAFRESLVGEESKRRLDGALTRSPDRRTFLARQPLLGAFREIFLHAPNDASSQIEPMIAGIVLAHAVAAGFGGRSTGESDEEIAGMPAEFAVDLICNFAFNATDDLWSQMDRCLRLWRDFGQAGTDRMGGDHPRDILAAATGLEIEDTIALAFALFAHEGQRQRSDFAPPDFTSDMGEATKAAFLTYVSATPDELQTELSGFRSDWDFLAFQNHPVVRLPEGLVVIDRIFLMDRVTTGLYWVVHDHLKLQSDARRQLWTQAWGDMVEEMAESELRSHALPILGGGQTFYTEHDLASAYPGHKTSDVVLDFGDRLVAIEIVSGQLSTGTRVDGKLASFMSDMEKIAFKKLRQLHDTTECLLADAQSLTGSDGRYRVAPIIVAGGGFPNSPITRVVIDQYCEEQGLFVHPMVAAPVIIDLGELEMLEGLQEQGHLLLDLIEGWQGSTLSAVSLKNWLLRTFGLGHNFRRTRMKGHMDQFFAEMIERLRLRTP